MIINNVTVHKTKKWLGVLFLSGILLFISCVFIHADSSSLDESDGKSDVGSNPLKPNSVYEVSVAIRKYKKPNELSMANMFLNDKATITVDSQGVATVRYYFKNPDMLKSASMFRDKEGKETINTRVVGNESGKTMVEFVLPEYRSSGIYYGSAYIRIMLTQMKYALYLDFSNIVSEEENETLVYCGKTLEENISDLSSPVSNDKKWLGTIICFGNNESENSSIKWNLLDKHSGLAFASKNLGEHFFTKDQYFGKYWKESKIRDFLNGYGEYKGSDNFIKSSFSEREDKVLKVFGVNTDNEITQDRVFYLSNDELNNKDYGFVGNASRKSNGAYFTRNNHLGLVSTVEKDGSIERLGLWSYKQSGLRPAIVLDSEKIVFVSDYGMAKNVGLKSLNDSKSHVKRLTVLDENLSFNVEKAVLKGRSVHIDYTSKNINPNTYVSAFIKRNGKILYYGSIGKAESSAHISVELPSNYDSESDSIFVFIEERNSVNATDFAGSPHKLKLESVLGSGFGSNDIVIADGEYKIAANIKKSDDTSIDSVAAGMLKNAFLVLESGKKPKIRLSVKSVSFGSLQGYASEFKVYKSGLKSDLINANVIKRYANSKPSILEFEIPDKTADGFYINMYVDAMNSRVDAYVSLDYKTIKTLDGDSQGGNTNNQGGNTNNQGENSNNQGGSTNNQGGNTNNQGGSNNGQESSSGDQGNSSGTLKNGKYSVRVSLVKTNDSDLSMGDRAFDNNRYATLDAKDGVYTIQTGTNPISIGDMSAGLTSIRIDSTNATLIGTTTGTVASRQFVNSFTFKTRALSDYYNISFEVPGSPMQGRISARLSYDFASAQPTSSPFTSSSTAVTVAYNSSNSAETENKETDKKNSNSNKGVKIKDEKVPLSNSGLETLKENIAFVDIDKSSADFELVNYVVSNGLMNGISKTEFKPYENATKEMLITVLYRLNGSPKVEKKREYKDATRTWYLDAINWANEVNIATGKSESIFGIGDIIKGDVAVILYRAAKLAGVDTNSKHVEFLDKLFVRDYQINALNFAVKNEIMKIENQKINPRIKMSRIQLAKSMKKFHELIKQ